MGSGAVLMVERVSKRYGDHDALHEVSLEVAPGEVCGLLGPNGAGKTTLVSIIAGLRNADGGRVLVDGVDITRGGRAARTAVGLAAQETGVYPTVSVRGNLELFTRLAGYSGAGAAARLEEVAEVVELTHLLDRQARNLSGGEKRRLHTAMALVHRPKVLMLDEPTTGVDIATRSRLLAAISRLAEQEGCAVLYSTHYLPEVEELGASVAILDHGRVLARGLLSELVDQYGSGLVELIFDGPAPELAGATIDRSIARIVTDKPGPVAAAVVGSLGAHAEHLVSVDLTRPSLETVFLAVTGRTYSSDDPTEADGAAVAPAADEKVAR
jgi:ABC-2 type transport system ATP-binding protein